MDKKLKDTELEAVTGGTAPELPATKLAPSEYSGMFSSPTLPEGFEIHLYDGKIVDPTQFTAKNKDSQND